MKWGKRFQNENPIKEFIFLLDIWFAKVKEMDSICKLHKSQIFIYDDLRDLIPFVQFEQREKHPWRVLLLVTKSYFI